MFLGGNPLGHIPHLSSLRTVSFEVSCSFWEDAAKSSRARGIVDKMTRTLENMPPLKDGRPRQVKLIMEHGETEIIHIYSKRRSQDE
jgi:hypothetical protein